MMMTLQSRFLTLLFSSLLNLVTGAARAALAQGLVGPGRRGG